MKTTRTLLSFSAAALLASSAYAYSFSTPSLYEQTDGKVVYVTGGIGDGELEELEAAKSEYNFRLMNTSKSGAYVSDTSVVIENRQGKDVLATNTGPMLFATLPAGRYTVMAENGGVVQTKTITLGSKKPANVQFLWNANE